ncbi:MAG: hypothetical protein CSA65_05275 [Proteobacteria bacterium]|nr:MAG: hypothetical protein CSA65_05275 [Pseudomonadota bacterium]
MSWAWIIGAVVVVMALSAVWQVLARFVFAFTLAAGVLLIAHFRENPGEAMAGLAALGGLTLLRRPLTKLIGGIV